MDDKRSLVSKILADWTSRDALLALEEEPTYHLPKLLEREERPQQKELLEGLLDDRHHLTVAEYLERIPEEWKVAWAGREATITDWKPDDIRDDDHLFTRFILSGIPRFDLLAPHLGFYLYLKQAQDWYEETKDIEITLLDEDEAYTYARREYKRMLENSLYALNRYGKIRDDQYSRGRPYKAGAPQALLCFCVDRGNDITLLKGRQAAITSTMMLIALFKMLMRNPCDVVLLTDDKVKTGMDIVAKKVQGSFQLLPEWIRQNVVDALWSKEGVTMDFEKADSKVEKRKNSSSFNLLSADDPQAVNSKTPSYTFYDEVQNIKAYKHVRGEVKPTQLAEVDGAMRKVRSQCAWGTGNADDDATGDFEEEFRGILNAMESGRNTGGAIVLFFDWTCRPGITAKEYLQQRQEELDKRAGDPETALSIFNTHYPNSPDDAFMKGSGGIFPPTFIKRNRDALIRIPDEYRAVKGFFEPVYDNARPMSALKADHRFFIADVTFRPAKTVDELLKAPVEMYLQGDNTYIGRFFQGTDPIQSATGYSEFASAIWDAWGMEAAGCCGTAEKHLHPCVACVLRGRTYNPREMFTQSILMNMYYRNHGQRGCKELIEFNQGQDYIAYKQEDWIDQGVTLTMRTELPERYQRGKTNSNIGFQMMADTKASLLGDIESLGYNHGHNIKFPVFWEQISTIRVEDKDGRKTWGTVDYKKFNDDVVIAVGLAKVNRDAHGGRPAKVGSENAPLQRTKMTWRRINTPMGSQVIQVPEQYTVRY